MRSNGKASDYAKRQSLNISHFDALQSAVSNLARIDDFQLLISDSDVGDRMWMLLTKMAKRFTNILYKHSYDLINLFKIRV